MPRRSPLHRIEGAISFVMMGGEAQELDPPGWNFISDSARRQQQQQQEEEEEYCCSGVKR